MTLMAMIAYSNYSLIFDSACFESQYVLYIALVWFCGTDLGRINEFTLRWAGLVLGWVTVCEWKTISVCTSQPGRATQLSHPSVVRPIRIAGTDIARAHHPNDI